MLWESNDDNLGLAVGQNLVVIVTALVFIHQAARESTEPNQGGAEIAGPLFALLCSLRLLGLADERG